jgi:FMN-dependent NADH-azoreductase
MTALKLLLLDCSPRHDNSTSRHLTEHLLPTMATHYGRDIRMVRRLIGIRPLPSITAEYADSLLLSGTEAKQPSDPALAVSDKLIEELEQADFFWISTPVHNFTVPAVLKNWIDLVLRRDVTYTSTADGKVGLLRDRPTFVAVTSGGAMFQDPPIQPDFFRPYLSAVLEVIGIKNVTYVHATGLASSDAPLARVEEKAEQWLRDWWSKVTSSKALGKEDVVQAR